MKNWKKDEILKKKFENVSITIKHYNGTCHYLEITNKMGDNRKMKISVDGMWDGVVKHEYGSIIESWKLGTHNLLKYSFRDGEKKYVLSNGYRNFSIYKKNKGEPVYRPLFDNDAFLKLLNGFNRYSDKNFCDAACEICGPYISYLNKMKEVYIGLSFDFLFKF